MLTTHFSTKSAIQGEKKILIPFMATVHFTKYNSKWFIHSWGRASTTVVQITCPFAGFDEPEPKLSESREETCIDFISWAPVSFTFKNQELSDQVGDVELYRKPLLRFKHLS